jgi:hypothetical protein
MAERGVGRGGSDLPIELGEIGFVQEEKMGLLKNSL